MCIDLAMVEKVVADMKALFSNEITHYGDAPVFNFIDQMFSTVARELLFASSGRRCQARYFSYCLDPIKHYRDKIVELILPAFRVHGFVVDSGYGGLCTILSSDLSYMPGRGPHALCCGRRHGQHLWWTIRKKRKQDQTLEAFLRGHKHFKLSAWIVNGWMEPRLPQTSAEAQQAHTNLPVMNPNGPPVGATGAHEWRAGPFV
jgi:hypothetical protein